MAYVIGNQPAVFAPAPQIGYPPGQGYAVRRTPAYSVQETPIHPQPVYTKNRTSGYTICLVVLIVILVLLLIGALVWGTIVTNKALNRDPAPTPTTRPPPPLTVPTTRVPVTLPTPGPPIINTDLIQFDKRTGNYMNVEGRVCVPPWTWDSTLSSLTSVRAKDYAEEFCEVVGLIFGSTSLSGGLGACTVTEFSDADPAPGVCVTFDIRVWKALDISVVGLYRLVLNQLHCGLDDGSLNYRFTIDNLSVEFHEMFSGEFQDHEICDAPGTCVRSGLNYECPCRDGHQLADNAFTCEDHNECLWFGGGCEHTCVNTPGSRECRCDAGYVLAADGVSCDDINECDPANPTHNCDLSSGATCVNRVGDYYCSCPSGNNIEHNEATGLEECADMNECYSEMDTCEQVCRNTDGSYMCDCRDGYMIMSEEKSCQDINECDDSNPTHDCDTTSSELLGCLNEPAGSYTCKCKPGYESYYFSLIQKQSCRDINECDLNKGDCEQICTNTQGSFDCSCHSGYELDNDGRNCNDIDECLRDTDNCETDAPPEDYNDPTCVNTPGSFTCACPAGFFPNNDNITCTDINECQDDMAGCDQGCLNIPGDYECTCGEGYAWSAVLGKCDDQDECSQRLATGDCSTYRQMTGETVCINTVGSFHCICEIGYHLVAGTCINYNECLNATTNVCNPGGIATCTDEEGVESVNPLGFECGCPATFWEVNADGLTCDDVDECLPTNPCANDAQDEFLCINNLGAAHSCVCPLGTDEYLGAGPCTDTDECATSADNCEMICVNEDRTDSDTAGRFHCACYPGYTLDGDGFSCSDIAECSVPAPATAPDCNTGTCTDTVGGYECTSCVNPEYQGPDATTCITFDALTVTGTITLGNSGTVTCNLAVNDLEVNNPLAGTSAPSITRLEWVISDGSNPYQSINGGAQTLSWNSGTYTWELVLDYDSVSSPVVLSGLPAGSGLLCVAEYNPPDGQAAFNDDIQVTVA